jgi:predicted nucleic acid-binding protein
LIFVDTSFFFASSEPSDYEHPTARALFESLDRPRLVTTNHVRGETWSLVRRRSGHRRAVHFLDLLEESRSIQLFDVTPEIERSALAWLRRHDEREYSFVDATSFAFMRENRISEVLAFDGDFTAAGFVELRP